MPKKAAPKPPKPSPLFAGKVCEICGRKYEPHAKTGKYPRFIRHHLKYRDPEVIAVVCLSCHNWLSGNGKVYSHPLKPRNMTDEERAAGPFLFALAVVDLYDRKLIQPALVEELNRAQAERMARVPGGTVH
jgi:hypothetical protein